MRRPQFSLRSLALAFASTAILLSSVGLVWRSSMNDAWVVAKLHQFGDCFVHDD